MIKIGVFDSGLGGLLTARYIKRQRPDVGILYFGDTAHLPYGDKSPAQIRSYVKQIITFLKAEGAGGIVIACNTASSIAGEEARSWAAPLPVWDAVSATLAAFRRDPPTWPLGIIGTHTTIRSGVYGRAIRELWPNARTIEQATPLLVPLVEEGWVEHPATELILQTYLQHDELSQVQGLLLACTHYPLLEAAIQRALARLNRSLAIYDTAALLAQAVIRDLPAPTGQEGADAFWVSDYTERFAQLAERFWGEAITIEEVRLSAMPLSF